MIPPANGNNAVITVKVGGDRSGVNGVTALAGVVLGFYDAATGGSAVFTCTSDVDGDCSITVPDTQQGGVNRDRRFYVRQVSAPGGWFSNPSLRTGNSDDTGTQITPYVFQTGPQLRAGTTYSSQSAFMIGTGNTDRLASGGIWQNSRNNPVFPNECGLKVALVLDFSGSTAGFNAQLKGAANTFVNSLVGTPSQMALFSFSDDSPASGATANRPALTPVSTQAQADAFKATYAGWTSGGGTNWDRGLGTAATGNTAANHYDVVVMITDGNPTRYSSPPQGPQSFNRIREVEQGIFSANALKAAGTRVIAVGVGSGVTQPATALNLRSISGPTLNSDYYQSADYSQAGAALRALALGNCSGTLTVVKQVLPPGTPANSQAGAVPAGGWTFGAVASGGVTVAPASGVTATGTGALNFNLTFPGGTTSAGVTLTETLQPNYVHHPVAGANAVCTRLDTGAALAVTNAASGPGFTVAANSGYPVSCTIYNTAPQPPASMVVAKIWNVNGTRYVNGAQPPELSAALTLGGTPQEWGVVRTGLNAGQVVPINETVTIAPSSLCTLTSSRLTDIRGTTADLPLPYSATLNAGENAYAVTNTVNCPARLTLVKTVVNGPAAPTAWNLTANAPTGALPGPTGTTGVTAPVTPQVTYPLAESAGDPRYIQLADPNAVAIPGSTVSWFCVQVNPTTGAVIPGFADGLNGGVTVPLGFAVRCEARNVTTELTLVKQVVNSFGGTAVSSAWNLTATPVAPPTPPVGLTPVTVTGSTAGQLVYVRPGQTYSLTESTGPPGYVLDHVECVTSANSTPRSLTTIAVAADESAVCTFVNRDLPAKLTLVKTVTNDNGGTALPTAWTLSATGPTSISGTTGSAPVTAATVNAGSYSLSEANGAAGYAAGAWSCTGGTLTGATVVVPNGGDVTCTINNNDQPAQLTLVKTVTNDNGGTALPTAWTLAAAGPTPISGTTGSAPVTAAAVNAGSYTLSEANGPAGYTAGAWSCTGATVTGSTVVVPLGGAVTCTINNNDQPAQLTLVKTVTNDNGGTALPTAWTLAAAGPTPISGTTGSAPVTAATVSAGSYTLSEANGPAGYTAGAWSCTGATVTGSTVVVPLGGSVTCTINNNDQPAQLTLVKTVTNTNGGTALPTQWTLAAAGPSPISGQTGSPAVTNAAVNAGSYALSESGGPGGYVAGPWACTGGTVTGTSVAVPNGGNVTCTINNADAPAKLTLVKVVDPAASGSGKVPADWTLTATPVNITGQGPVTGNGDPTSPGGVNQVTVFSGSYGLSETGPGGFTPGAWICQGGVYDGTNVNVPVGGNVTCTITNTAITPKLTLKKVVVNQYGGTAIATDWTLTATGPSPISGKVGDPSVTAAPVLVGTYTLGESGPAGYTASAWVCTGAASSTGTSVVIAEGNDATCTITNTDQQARLTLVKTVTNNNGGAAVPTDWNLSAAGPTPVTDVKTGTTTTVNSGSYALSESGGPAGYLAGAWSCTGATPTGSDVIVPSGGDVTCTINNDDQPARLTLVKTVTNDNGGTALPTAWTLNGAGPTSINGPTGSPAVTGAIVDAGAYVLTETGGPTGYAAGAWTCTGAPVAAGTVTVPNGGDVTCTINNNDLPATLTLVKVVVNGTTGGTATPEQWTLTAAGPTPVTGPGNSPQVTSQTVNAGAYALSEADGPAGYAASAWECAGGTLTDTSVAVPNGGTVTCTITNTAQQAYLTLVKTVVNDNGGTGRPDATGSCPPTGPPAGFNGGSGSPAVTKVPVELGGCAISTRSSGPDGYASQGYTCTNSGSARWSRR